MKPSSQPPQNSAEQRRQIIDQFAAEFTPEDRQIFREWRAWREFIGIDLHAYANMGQLYGDQFRKKLIYGIQQLVETTGISFEEVVSGMEQGFGKAENYEAVVSDIYQRLNPSRPSQLPVPQKEPEIALPVSVRPSVEEVIDPYSKTVYSSNPPSGEPTPSPSEAPTAAKEPQIIAEKVPMPKQSEADKLFLKEMYQFIDELPYEQRQMLPYLTGPRQAVTDKEPVSEGRKKVNFLSLDLRFSSFIRRRGRTRDEAEKALSIALKSTPPESEFDSGVRTTIDSQGAAEEQAPDTQKRRGILARILGR